MVSTFLAYPFLHGFLQALTAFQENPLATLAPSKSPSTQTPAHGGQRDLSGRQRISETRDFGEGGGAVEKGDAKGGGDGTEGQVYDV